MAIEVGGSSWYTPKSYGRRGGSEWATGKNTAPDRYTEDELRKHYDFVHNDPVAKMRPTKALPSDANEQRYDWVFNIRSNEGRWQLHNPNGLNAHRSGLDPYDWDDGYTRNGSTTRSASVKDMYAPVQAQSFDSAFKAAIKPESVAPPAPAAELDSEERASAVDTNLSRISLNRNAAIQSIVQQMAQAQAASKSTYDDILSIINEKQDKASKI